MESWVQFNEEETAAINEASVAKTTEGFKQLESGIYPVVIVAAYIRKTDSGAEMFELSMMTKDEVKCSWSTCVRSGDAKGNATTWTVGDHHSESTKKRYGIGTKVPLPGYQELAQLFAAFGSEMKDHQPEMTQIEHRGDTIEAKVFKDLTGKRFQIAVQQYEEEYNGEINVKLDYQMFLDMEGNNAKGENQEEKFLKKISKVPLRKLKVKPAVEQAKVQEAANTGW